MTFDNIMGIAEIAILALTLLISVGLSVFVVRQTQKHFSLEHAQKFIERFNNNEMVVHQQAVDKWVNANKSVRLLVNDQGLSNDQLSLRRSIVAVANFFQELGTADKHGVVHRLYTWDVFGAMIGRYWQNLSPFIIDLRAHRDRHTLFQDFEDLADRMARIDKKKVTRQKEHFKRDETDPPIYLFGYGSLINKASMEKTLGREIDPREIRTAWLNSYRRTWNLYDMVVANSKIIPMAFYTVEPDQSSRCNGVLVPVHQDDFENLDIRERNYDRVDVSELIWPAMQGKVVTYVGKPEVHDLPPDTVVAESYEKLVNEGVRELGCEFERDFNESTLNHQLARISVRYKFKDSMQERVS